MDDDELLIVATMYVLSKMDSHLHGNDMLCDANERSMYEKNNFSLNIYIDFNVYN